MSISAPLVDALQPQEGLCTLQRPHDHATTRMQDGVVDDVAERCWSHWMIDRPRNLELYTPNVEAYARQTRGKHRANVRQNPPRIANPWMSKVAVLLATLHLFYLFWTMSRWERPATVKTRPLSRFS
jgi:hypothetical protein